MRCASYLLKVTRRDRTWSFCLSLWFVAHFGAPDIFWRIRRIVTIVAHFGAFWKNLSKIIENPIGSYYQVLLLRLGLTYPKFGVQVRINEMKPLHLEIVRP